MDLALLQYEFVQNAVIAGFCAGTACALVGVFVVTMHLSFLGVCIAHAAFAGALMGVWLGFEPYLGALALSLTAAGIIGPLSDRGELSPDTSIGIVFSLMLGLAFIFIGLTPGSRTAALSLLWGRILTVSRGDVVVLAITTVLMLCLLKLFFKEIQAVVCHRHVALAAGIPATAIFYGLLFSTGVTITACLPSIGGMLVFCLVLNPAAAAFQLTYSLKRMFVLAAVFGVLSCWVGLAVSYAWDLMAGASIVITSTVIFAAATLASPKKKALRWDTRRTAK
ncbi:MAG: metal ABC transporter permease [Nitrospiraceae bacterium]|nr:metal ABC transporter permease [Nitrospiraceae bacterium]